MAWYTKPLRFIQSLPEKRASLGRTLRGGITDVFTGKPIGDTKRAEEFNLEERKYDALNPDEQTLSDENLAFNDSEPVVESEAYQGSESSKNPSPQFVANPITHVAANAIRIKMDKPNKLVKDTTVSEDKKSKTIQYSGQTSSEYVSNTVTLLYTNKAEAMRAQQLLQNITQDEDPKHYSPDSLFNVSDVKKAKAFTTMDVYMVTFEAGKNHKDALEPLRKQKEALREEAKNIVHSKLGSNTMPNPSFDVLKKEALEFLDEKNYPGLTPKARDAFANSLANHPQTFAQLTNNPFIGRQYEISDAIKKIGEKGNKANTKSIKAVQKYISVNEQKCYEQSSDHQEATKPVKQETRSFQR